MTSGVHHDSTCATAVREAPSTASSTATPEAPVEAVRAVLADGQVALVRPLGPADQDAVLALYEGLDERDRYFRFFGPLPPRLADLVASMVSTGVTDRAALGAFLRDRLVGIAHYEALTDPTRAELALAVSATVQARGVGTLLLEHLVSLARRRGVRRFVADVLTSNTRMLRVFHDCGLPCRWTHDAGVTQVELTLEEVGPYLDAMAERERQADAASLRAVLRPESVAVLGAGRRPGSIGRAVLDNIVAGGFTGRVYAVNPHAEGQVAGVPAVREIEALPEPCDLAVLCVPAAAVPEAAERCGRHGVRALVVISAGITGEPHLRDGLLAAVRRYGMRMVGPNCVGVSIGDPTVRLDATFAPSPAPAGTIGLVTQSGGVGVALRERLRSLGLGLSAMVSTGDKYDVSSNDLLMWWQGDQATRAVALYLESFGNPRKFARLARVLARTTPVVAVRTGTSEAARRAAASHTAATATPSVTRDALYRQAGVIAVDGAGELVETLAALSWQPLPAGNRIAVLTNAGGAGVLASDACAPAGVVLADFTPRTLEALQGLLPGTASTGNPVDTTAGVDAATFARCVAAVRADPGVDAVVVATVPTAMGDPIDGLSSWDTQDLWWDTQVTQNPQVGQNPPAGRTPAPTPTPLLAVRLGQPDAVAALRGPDGTPATASYADPASAVAALGRLAAYTRWRDRPDAPTTMPAGIDVPRALEILREHLRCDPDGGWLDPVATVGLLGCFGIPTAPTTFAADEDAAVRAFAAPAGAAAVKAVAEGVLHKSVRGGVLLDVRDEVGIRAAVRLLRQRFGAALRGVVVQPMADAGREFLVGVNSDGLFGPLVVFGLGGVDTDVVADRAACLAPVGRADADGLLHGLRASPRVFGPAAGAALDADAVRDVLLRVGLLAHLLPEVVELDLNPLVVRARGCEAVDARVRIAPVRSGDPLLPRLRA